MDIKKSIVLLKLVKEYMKAASDKTMTPEDAWKNMQDRVSCGDLSTLLIICESNDGPEGFMYGHIDKEEPGVAVINTAYLRPGVDSQPVVDEALTRFERWARFNEVRAIRFFTFRTPGAHRFMMKRGYRHVMTAYLKEA